MMIEVDCDECGETVDVFVDEKQSAIVLHRAKCSFYGEGKTTERIIRTTTATIYNFEEERKKRRPS